MNNKKQQYERIGILTLDDVFPHIEAQLQIYKKSKVQIKDFFLNVQSLRLKTFYNCGLDCPCCENKASFFAVERAVGNTMHGYHLNLYGYGKNNEEILFTHDHILARALGGADNLSNTQTMCGECNWAKGKLEYLLKNTTNPIEEAYLKNKIEKYNIIKKNKFLI
jgi:hypothetical protein